MYERKLVTIRESVNQALDSLGDRELSQVAEFVAFLRFRSRARWRPAGTPEQWSSAFAEFADEDRLLAEAGMADFARALAAEDQA